MNVHPHKKPGWSWSMGWRSERGEYFVRMTMWLDKSVWIDSQLIRGIRIAEHGATIEEAAAKLMQRLDGLEGLGKEK